MRSPSGLSDMLWIAWLLVWLGAARWSKRTKERQGTRAHLFQDALLALGFLLIFLPWRSASLLAHAVVPQGAGLAWTGVTGLACGLAFTLWARVHLGRNWSGDVVLKEDHALVHSGPYALTRHPIYTGLLLGLAGMVLVKNDVSALVGLLVAAAALMVKSRQEERFMVREFGEAYERYRSEVPALLPAWPRRRG